MWDKSSTDIPQSLIGKMKKSGGSFDFHVHPYEGDIRPSQEDMSVIAMFEEEIGQQTSKIISIDGMHSIYNKYGIVETGRVSRKLGEDYEKFVNELFK